MTTKQIDYCIELARTLNFSRAAENAFVSQPTFSYQVKLLEDEVGFKIFERNGKGAALTPAGQQFVTYLSGMREDMKRAIEQGQNFSARYTDNITVSMMVRQAIYFLPEAIRIFEKEQPGVQVTPLFQYDNGVESFLKDESDVLFALIEQTKHIPGINVHNKRNISRGSTSTSFLTPESILLSIKTILWQKRTSSQMKISTDAPSWLEVALRTLYVVSSRSSSPPVRSNILTVPITTLLL